jgi:hypothetical protein
VSAAALSVIAIVATGCSDRDSGSTSEAPRPVVEEVEPQANDSLVMPEYPDPQRGRLVARSAGLYELGGAWEARAGICEDPAMLELVAEQPGIGTLVLLQLPPAEERVTRYPVAIVESGPPQPPASQVGVQVFKASNAHAFQALEGDVEVYAFGERISGRYAVTLREISSDDRAMTAGVFEAVGIERLPDEQCQAVKEQYEAVDSTSSADES